MVSHETSSTFKISNLVKKLRKSRVVKILSHDAPLSALTGGLRQKMLIVEKKEIIFLAAHHASHDINITLLGLLAISSGRIFCHVQNTTTNWNVLSRVAWWISKLESQ